MTVEEFVDSIGDFSSRKLNEQVRLFAWYLTSHRGMPEFGHSDIGKCFRTAALSGPANLSDVLTRMVTAKPPVLLRGGSVVVTYQLVRDHVKELDQQLRKRPAALKVEKLLEELPAKLPVDVERVYLDEALSCFKIGALRAAVVMAWNLAFDHLCSHILSTGTTAFNAALMKSLPKCGVTISKREDFCELKEFDVVKVAMSAGIINPNIEKVMQQKLVRRNLSAHPTGVTMTPHTAEEFIIDLMINAVLKF